MSAEEQCILSSFSFNSMFMSLPGRSKLLRREPHHSGWRASGGGRMDCLFLYLQRRNLANAPARHVWTAPAARRRRVQADGGAGDGEREGERAAERKRALAQVGCYPMMACASTAWRNTTCTVPSANADLFHPLQTQDVHPVQNTSLMTFWDSFTLPGNMVCHVKNVSKIPNLSTVLNNQKSLNKICDKSHMNARWTHWPLWDVQVWCVT